MGGREVGVSDKYRNASALATFAPADKFEVFIRLDKNEAETWDGQHAPNAVMLDVPRRLANWVCNELHTSGFPVVENTVVCLNLHAGQVF